MIAKGMWMQQKVEVAEEERRESVSAKSPSPPPYPCM